MKADDLTIELKRLADIEDAKARNDKVDKLDRLESAGKAQGLLIATNMLLQAQIQGDIK